MTASHQLVYFIFAIVLVLALILDLGLLSKKNKTITIKQALLQTLFWVALALGFFVFVWVEEGQKNRTRIPERLFDGMEFKCR